MTYLTPMSWDEMSLVRRAPVDSSTLAEAAAIVEDVRQGGEKALRRYGEQFGDLSPGQSLVVSRDELARAFESLAEETQMILSRAAVRIRAFAEMQKSSLSTMEMQVDGGSAGHRLVPVRTVGAYAPGGRHPLPSSVLMTAIPARVAGVDRIIVASPRPHLTTLAAAHVAGADQLLAVGGAQAIAALAFGVGCSPCDMVVGPGNRWVTAAKKHLYGEIGIDGLAGPSEVVVVADHTADPTLIAADLLAQAEHDPDARVGLVTTDSSLPDQVDERLREQIENLPTADTAGRSLDSAFCVVTVDIEEVAEVCDQLAPEHLSLHIANADKEAKRFNSFGSLFIGDATTEAHGDYGIGPNHVLPTGGTARFQSGLSPLTFLKSPTWLRIDNPSDVAGDVVEFARLEGLEAHARAAAMRDG